MCWIAFGSASMRTFSYGWLLYITEIRHQKAIYTRSSKIWCATQSRILESTGSLDPRLVPVRAMAFRDLKINFNICILSSLCRLIMIPNSQDAASGPRMYLIDRCLNNGTKHVVSTASKGKSHSEIANDMTRVKEWTNSTRRPLYYSKSALYLGQHNSSDRAWSKQKRWNMMSVPVSGVRRSEKKHSNQPLKYTGHQFDNRRHSRTR